MTDPLGSGQTNPLQVRTRLHLPAGVAGPRPRLGAVVSGPHAVDLLALLLAPAFSFLHITSRFLPLLPTRFARLSMRSTLFLTSAVALLATDCAARISGYVDASSADLQQVLRQNYTYIVVGGGNTGLVVASRLSEDARKTVLVIEAGKSARETSGVIVPGLSGSTFLSEVDWAFFTTPQANAHNRSVCK